MHVVGIFVSYCISNMRSSFDAGHIGCPGSVGIILGLVPGLGCLLNQECLVFPPGRPPESKK